MNYNREEYQKLRDRELKISEMVKGIKYCVTFYKHFKKDEDEENEYDVYEICKGKTLYHRQ